MRETWVDNLGKIHEGGNHYCIAQKLFPESRNPELLCEKIGYVKTGTLFNGSPMMENYDKSRVTQAQINAVHTLWEEHYKKKLR